MKGESDQLTSAEGSDLDGGGVGCGAHLLSQIHKNTATCRTVLTGHLLKACRRSYTIKGARKIPMCTMKEKERKGGIRTEPVPLGTSFTTWEMC